MKLTTCNLLLLLLLITSCITISQSHHFHKKHLIFGKLKLKKWLVPKLIIGKSFAVKGALFAHLLHKKKKPCCVMVVHKPYYPPPPPPYYGGGGGGQYY